MRVFVVLGFVLAVFVFTTGHVLLTTRSGPLSGWAGGAAVAPADRAWFFSETAPDDFSFLPLFRSSPEPLSLAEQAWVAAHPVATVSLSSRPGNAEGDVGVLAGITLDHLRLLAQRTGLRFRLAQGEGADVLAPAPAAIRDDLIYSPPYARLPEPEGELRMAVQASRPELAAILEKALNGLSLNEQHAISRRWLEEPSGFSGRPFWYGLLALQGVAGVLLLVLFWNAQLRRKVEERTRRLAVELEKSARTGVLESLNAELREAAEAKSRFLANISHEIRTPLHGIISFTELAYLKDQPLPRRHQRTILDLAYALLDIVNDTLDFSKIEAGGMTTDIVPFALDDVVRRVCDMTIHGSRARELACVVDIDPATPPALVGDASRLQQVLTNLMSNAVKFTPAGGRVHLQVRPASTRMAGGAARTRLLFFVHDTGVGIAPEHMQRLFKPFGQVDASLTRQRGGTGLGLSIARHMVEKMSGEIWVESEPGQGSTFAFSLPFGLQEQVEALAGSSFVGMQAVVVGGTDLGGTVLARTLEALGFRVRRLSRAELQHPAAHLAHSAEAPPDVVVIDRMHGEEPRSPALTVLDALNQRFGTPVPALLFGGPQEELAADTLRAANDAGPQRVEVVRAVSLGLFRTALRGLMGKGAHVGQAARQSWAIPELSGVRILVVEDNPVNREIMAAQLEDTHADLHMATNGNEALARLAFAETPFDLVFLDIQMPDMDGYATIKAIRERGQTLPVVAITAHAMQTDKQRCLDAGMDAYLSKPFKQALLFDVIRQLLPDLCKTPEGDASALRDTDTEPLILPPCFAESVVRQTGLTMARFRSVLQSFSRSHSRDEALMRRCAQLLVDAGPEQLDKLRILAHTLKGASANLGAQDLREASLRLEREAARRLKKKDFSPFPPDLLDELGVALTTVLVAAETLRLSASPDSLASSIAASSIAASSGTASNKDACSDAVHPLPEPAPSLPDVLHELREALREASPSRVRAAAAGLPASDRWRELQEQIDDYDYEAALASLDELTPSPFAGQAS